MKTQKNITTQAGDVYSPIGAYRLSKVALVLGLFLFCTNAFAHPIDMKILAQIESSNNPKAHNKRTNAKGLYQITPIVFKQFMLDATKKYGVPLANSSESLFYEEFNTTVANYYLDWLSHRCYVPDDILISWNWGYGHWRKWANNGGNMNALPKETKDFLKKYHNLTR